MSGLEIERKFLVHKGGAYRDIAFSRSHIQQGYIPAQGVTIRIRLRDEQAFLTIKSHSTDGGLSRYEFEKEISLEEASQLLALCQGGVIDKHRYLVRCGNHTYEVDEFHGNNEGLVIAEVELADPNETFDKPDSLMPLGETTCQRNTDKLRQQHSYRIGQEVYPVTTASATCAIGLQYLYHSTHQHGKETSSYCGPHLIIYIRVRT